MIICVVCACLCMRVCVCMCVCVCVCACLWVQNMVKEFQKKADAIDSTQCSKQHKLSLLLLQDQLHEYLEGAAFKA